MTNDVPRTRLTDAESDLLYQAVHGALRSHATPRIDPDTDLDAAMHYIDAAVERIVARRQENAWDRGYDAGYSAGYDDGMYRIESETRA